MLFRSHELENRLSLLRSGLVQAQAETFQALLACRDRCNKILSISQDQPYNENQPPIEPALDDEDSLYLSALDGTLTDLKLPEEEPNIHTKAIQESTPDLDQGGYIELGQHHKRKQVSRAESNVSTELIDRKTVRITDEKLDTLINLIGELVTVQSQLAQLATELGQSRLTGISDQIRRLMSELRGTSMEMRMVPASLLFNRFRRVVRDLGTDLGKLINLHIEGAGTELDKSLIESLYEPLLHLVRNAAAHGLEGPDQREAVGKKKTGLLTLSAAHTGASVTIEVKDDGAGIDDEAIRDRAIASGLLSAEARPTVDQLRALLFKPGFSTAGQISSLSGRGVGLDIVKTSVERLGGNLNLVSERGKSTTFILEIPLTIAIIDGFLVRLGDQKFIIPLQCIAECFEQTRTEQRERLISRNGELLPVVYIQNLFPHKTISRVGNHQEIIIAKVLDGKFALVFDQLLGGYQTVIKPLGELARFCPGISGSTILADGQIALILDMQSLARSIQTQS